MSKVKFIILIIFILGIAGYLTYFAINVSKELKEEKTR